MPAATRILVAVSVALAVWTSVEAQAPPATGRVSPRAELSAVVDGVEISMEYGRPSKRGRVIWGTLVPWTKWWMPGADESTSFVTSGALQVGDLLVPAGKYTIYTQPGPDLFTLIVNRQTGQFHTLYRQNMDLGRVPMTLTWLPEVVEQMTFTITPSPAAGGVLALSWDDRAYSVTLRAAPAQP
jgi:hypothetical protein